MPSSVVNDNDNSKFLHHTFTKNILNSHKSIRWVSIIDQNDITVNERYRKGLKPLLSVEEIHEFAKNTLTRHKTRLKLEPKIGKLTYLFRRYEKLSSCITSISEQYYLLLTMDFEENNFDKL